MARTPRRAARRATPARAQQVVRPDAAVEPTIIERVMDMDESSVLDLLDHVLSKGVMATGDLTLGVAGIDLIYVRLSALLCAADRVLPSPPETKRRSARRSSRPRAPR